MSDNNISARMSLSNIGIASAFQSVEDNYRRSSVYKTAALCFLHTFLDPNVLTSIRWQDVDLEEGLLSIREGRNPRIMPISDQVVDLLAQLAKKDGAIGYVFGALGIKQDYIGATQISNILSSVGTPLQLNQVEHLGLAKFLEFSSDRDLALVHFGYTSSQETFLGDGQIEERRRFCESWSNQLMSLVSSLRKAT
tara:strand:- start:6282 stop:6866 length:585 start_codon:yes stop_codon:yes gene_type:complete